MIILDALGFRSNHLPSPAISSSLAALESDRPYLPPPSCLCQAFIIFCLDYYNGLLTGLLALTLVPKDPSSTVLPETF